MNIPIPAPNQFLTKKFAVGNKDTLISSFSFESELSKIKIPVPLLELLKNPAYRESFQRLLQLATLAPDSVDLEEERPAIYLGNRVQNQNDDNPPPFYLSLII